jgi:Leucine-rich repeat (LRR) protein
VLHVSAVLCRGNLQVLDLSRNNLSGPLPEVLGDASHMSLLRLSDNQLTGLVPDSYSVLAYASLVALDRNSLAKGARLPSWVTMAS